MRRAGGGRCLASPVLGAVGTADIVTYHHDPRDDPGQLGRPAAVVAAGIRQL